MRKLLFYITIFMFVLGMCCLNLAPDNDLWARLIAGGHIVENLKLLKYDFLSYTPTHPWYDHEWGASVIFYIVLKYFGGTGLIFLKGIVMALTMFFCIKTVKLRKPQSSTTYNIFYFALMFYAATSAIGLITRCLIFTCLFFTIFLYILERARTGKTKSLIWLPIIMILWSNIHGGCMAGLGLIGLYCVGEFLNKKEYKQYIYTLLASLVTLFINPYGFEYVKFLFFAALMKRELIAEWQNSFISVYATSYLKYKFYLVIMGLTEIIYLIKNKINYAKLDKTKILVLLVVTILSILKIRHQTFFVLAAGTLLYDEFYSLVNSIKIWNNKKLTITKDIILYTVLLGFSVNMLFFASKEIRITEQAYPRFAIEFIKINEIKGNLFLNFNWGSYAAYKLYPNNRIVMDGRYEEVYHPSLLEEMRDFHMLKNDWKKIIRENKTDVMILDKQYPVYEKILEDKEWKLVFENNLSGVFVPTQTAKNNYKYPVPNDEYYNDNLFKTDIKHKI